MKLGGIFFFKDGCSYSRLCALRVLLVDREKLIIHAERVINCWRSLSRQREISKRKTIFLAKHLTSSASSFYRDDQS